MEMQRMFVSETELEEKRKKRQEEWTKVRTSDQPEEAPEEEVDNRSLYDRLQEQKIRKQEEFDEARKLKNLVRGIDDDESDFLGTVDEMKEKIIREKELEEQRELKEFHERRGKLIEEEDATRANGVATVAKPTVAPKKSQQHQLILKGVKRKAAPEERPDEVTKPCRMVLPGMDCYEASSSDDSDSERDDSVRSLYIFNDAGSCKSTKKLENYCV